MIVCRFNCRPGREIRSYRTRILGEEIALRCHLLVVFAIVVVAGCRGGESPSSDPQGPGAQDALVAALLADARASQLAGDLDAASSDRLIRVHDTLLDELHGDAGADIPAIRLRDAVGVVDGVLAQRGMECYAAETAYLRGIGPAVATRVLAVRRECATVFAATGSPGERIAQLLAARAEMDSLGDVFGPIAVCSQLSILARREGDFGASLQYQRRSLVLARRSGRLQEECHAYGQVLMAKSRSGWSTADVDTLHALIARGRQAHLVNGTTILMTVRGMEAYLRGRYFTARTSLEDAVQTARRSDQPAVAVPIMVILGRLYDSLGCPEQALAVAEAANGLLDEYAAIGTPDARHELNRVQLDILTANQLAARRDPDAAAAAFRAAYAEALTLPYEEAGFAVRTWVEALLDLDRPDLSALALAQAESLAAARGLTYLVDGIPLWQARLAWARGDAAATEAALLALDSQPASPGQLDLGLRTHRRALSALAYASRDSARAAADLLAGWVELQHDIGSGQWSSESYLAIGRNRHLLDAAQSLAVGDAAARYGLEMLWRDAMYGRGKDVSSCSSLRREARARAETAMRRFAASGDIHCLYRVAPDSVTRWTVDGDGVVEEHLSLDTETLRDLVRGVLKDLGTAPRDRDAAVPADLGSKLAGLARVLLPSRFWAAGETPATLFLTGDGFLAQLPFAPLNLGRDAEYLPLAAVTNVVWVRHGTNPPAASGPGRVLAVGNPTLNDATRRRFSFAVGLPGAEAELARVVATVGDCRLLTRDDATEAAVTASWPSVDIFYFVGHAVVDPQVPLATWLPLAPGTSRETYPGLGPRDILQYRFDHCRLVVLSGCATGRPLVDGNATAPSLGETFLDAGAEAVVQTFWPIWDADPVLRPERILGRWQDEGMLPEDAFHAELKRAMGGPRTYRHPFAWAAWSLEISGR